MRAGLLFSCILATGALVHPQIASAVKLASNSGGMGPLPNGAEFGHAVAALGDLDGDGIGDLAVGAHKTVPRGAIWILFLQSDGRVRESHRIAPGDRGLPVDVGQPDSFGRFLAAPGDVDGDGTPDLVTCNSKGPPWILRLAPDGSFLGAIPLPLPGGHRSMAGLGDLDGDGTVELALGGAPFFGQSAVWILSIDASGVIQAARRITAEAAGLADAPSFGRVVGAAGDVDQDGLPELGVLSSGPFGTWIVWLLFLNEDGSVRTSARLDGSTPGIGPNGNGFDSFFGYSIAGLGDVDADGTTDLGIGAVGLGGVNDGAFFVVYLNSDGSAHGSDRVDPPILHARGIFGSGLASPGDLDQDGKPDIAAGHARLDIGRGAVWMLELIQHD